MPEETTVKERLVAFIKSLGIGQSKFEKSVGLSNGYVNNIRRSIQPDKLKMITEKYPDLSAGWLMTGEGTMLRQNDVEPMAVGEAKFFTENNHGNKYYKLPNDEMLIKVKLIPYDAFGSPEDDMDCLYPDRDEWEDVMFKADVVGRGQYYAFRVHGDSMDDGTRRGLCEGDLLLVRELQRDDWAPHLNYNRWPFWVVAWDNNIRVKQIIDEDERGRYITLHSLNPSPEYHDFRVRLDRVSHLFNVIRVRPREREF